MRHMNLLILSGLAAIISPLTACAQVDQAYQQMTDPMAVPQGMQAVAVTPKDLPANVDPAVAQAVQAQQQQQMQQQYAQQQQMQPMQQPVPQQDMQQPVPQNAPMPQAAMAPASGGQPEQANNQGNNNAQLPISIAHGITYMTGGNTEGEIAQLKALDGEFNLQVLFAAKSGEHLMNHAVRVLDYHNFELVAAKNVGPYLYLHINPGDYILEVTYEEGMKPASMKIKVPAKTRLRKTVLLK